MRKLLITSVLLVMLCLIILGYGSGCGKKPQYTLTIGADGAGEGTVQPAPGTYSYVENTVVTLKVTPAIGSIFDRWGGPDGASVSTANTIVMNGNKSVKAVFTKLKYPLTITVNPEDAGTVTTTLVTKAAAKDYDHGQTVRLTATPSSANYYFANWSGDLNETANPAELLIDSAKSVTANFIEAKMEIITQPTDSIAGQPMSGAPTIKVTTIDGTPLPNISVGVAEKAGQTFQGSKAILTNAAGLAIFDDLVFYEGHYTLVFSINNTGNMESNAFEVSLAGTGTEADPYLIHNLWGLSSIQTHLTACFRIENDIDASATANPAFNGGKGWLPIGKSASGYFAGQLDGNNKTISNLFINRPDEKYVALFYIVGYVDDPTVIIKDINLANVSITGEDYVGGLIATVEADDRLHIENCSVTGNITGTNWVGGIAGILRGVVINCHTDANVSSRLSSYYTGGLAGEAYKATITNCYAFGSVRGYRAFGGFLGWALYCSIDQCYAFVDVGPMPGVTDSAGVGGFVGWLNEDATITDCYSRGDVNGCSAVGGFSGMNYGTSIIRCYSSGAVTAEISCGGFSGFTNDPIASNIDCYYDSDTSGCSDTGNGEPMTTAEMKDSSNYSGSWNFSMVWNISPSINDGYPYLRNTPTE